MKKLLFIFIVLSCFTWSVAQEKSTLTLEDIYKNNTFLVNSVRGLRWMKNGSFYTSLVRNIATKSQDILKYATTTGETVDTLVHGKNLFISGKNITIASYQLSEDETKVLIMTDSERIYRRSSKANHYVYNIKTQRLRKLVDGDKQSYATFSPDGKKVAFVRDNNLYIKDLESDLLTAVTSDGRKNEIINGFADWVYEEELSLSKSFFWSPEGKYVAFLKFNETDVPVYNMQKWNGLYPEDYTYKYPKAGETNSVVTAHIYDLAAGNTREIKIGEEKDVYLARLRWLPTGSTISVIRLNRLQNKLDIFHADAKADQATLIYTEQTETYIDIDQVDDLTYLSDGKSFIISSEKSGFKHLYHYSIDGSEIGQITDGNWQVTEFEGIDQQKKLLYFTGTKESSIEHHLYAIKLNGKSMKKLSETPGAHSVSFSADFKFFIDTYSSSKKAAITSLCNANGNVVKVLAENSQYQKQTEQYDFAKTEFLEIPLQSGEKLNAYIMKPEDFDEQKKYPLLMSVYGGPGSQRVMNRWNSNGWHHFLVQHGYLVVCVDNRGTGGKGRDFQHITYKQLGKYESEDQIFAAKYLAKLPYIDEQRIGIWGWSYGGYMSSLAILLGNDIFKAAIAVAPVTNWRYYDTIYTERYLQKPQDNPSGYDDFSPISHVEKLNGSLLLIHGTGDDNVHFQNTVEFHNALIKANKQFDSFYYPNRNHSIYGGNTRLHLYKMMTNFILEKL